MLYKVVFTSDGIGMVNVAIAENMDSVKAEYNNYEIVAITETDEEYLNNMKKRGCPVIECPTVEPEACGLNVTNHTKNSKMDKMHSLNTSCLINERCQKRMQNGDSICAQCYAAAQLKRYKNQRESYIKNSLNLSSHILSDAELLRVNDYIFRFEAFGDLINDVHFINLINICNVNPHTHFALWTKNIDIIEAVLCGMGYSKPDNLTIVYSSLLLNTPAKIPEPVKPFIDHLFTVYNTEYAEAHDIHINCGSKHCIDCQLCYHKNNTFYINELPKTEQRKNKQEA